MRVSKGFDILLITVLLPFITSMMFSRTSEAQNSTEPYVLSQIVQTVASNTPNMQYAVLKKLVSDYPGIAGSNLVALYVDTLTGVDIIAKVRTREMSGKETVTPREEDVKLVFGLFCFPFGPPHKNNQDLKNARPKIFGGLYMDSQKRSLLEDSLNKRKLLTPIPGMNILDILNSEILRQWGIE